MSRRAAPAPPAAEPAGLPLPAPLTPERAARLAGPVRWLLDELARLWELPTRPG